jgi:hypothetical protein
MAIPTSHRLAGASSLTWADLANKRFTVSKMNPGPVIADCVVRHLTTIGRQPMIEPGGVHRDGLLAMVSHAGPPRRSRARSGWALAGEIAPGGGGKLHVRLDGLLVRDGSDLQSPGSTRRSVLSQAPSGSSMGSRPSGHLEKPLAMKAFG